MSASPTASSPTVSSPKAPAVARLQHRPPVECLAPLSLDVLDPRTFRRTTADLVERLAFRYGRSYDSYLATEPARELFWSRGAEGAVAFVRKGRYLNIAGGLLAADRHKPQLLAELIEYAAAQKLVLSFYNIPEEDLPLFRQRGFQVTKWGEEALVDLGRQTWTGKAFEWVRRQSNYCRRQRVSFAECRREALSAPEWERLVHEMTEIAGAAPFDKPQCEEIRFLQGSFDPRHLGRKRIFVARSQAGAGRIEAFLVANPGADGKLWVFEVYRHRPDAVRGAVPFLMHEAMQLLAREGVEKISLCLVPGLNCRERLPGDSWLVRRALSVGTRYFSFIFDAAGLYHFKTRFRPRFESRYLCVFPKVTLGSALAFVGLVNVLKLDVRKSLRIVGGRLGKWAQRSKLAGHNPAPPALETERRAA